MGWERRIRPDSPRRVHSARSGSRAAPAARGHSCGWKLLRGRGTRAGRTLGRHRPASGRKSPRGLPQRAETVRALVVGGGGREPAICWSLRRENPDAELYCAPGNPGTAGLAHNLAIAAEDIDRLADAADMYGIDLTIIGPEVPLARGLADRFRAEGRAVFGPSAAAAQLEASKAFAKQVMTSAGVRTAASQTFTDTRPALTYIDRQHEPLVVKASGLAAGKGVILCATRQEAAQ